MDKSKKNILLVIRRGASELEWIAPVIKISILDLIYILFIYRKVRIKAV